MNTKPLSQTAVTGCCMKATSLAATHSPTWNLQHFHFFNDALPAVMAYELNDRCYINVSLRHHGVLRDQWADNPSSYATNIGGSSAGDGAVWTPNIPSRAIYGTLLAVPGYLLSSVLRSGISLLTVQSSVFQTELLVTLGFRTGVSAVLRIADESLGIMCVVIIFSQLLL
jgi:hypothetical protein